MLETKIPPPIVGLLFALLIWWLASLTPSLIPGQLGLIPGVILLITGIGFAISGGISFHRAKTTVNPLKPETASSLVTSGVYRYTRNPMYLGLAIILLAWTLYLGAPAGLLGVVGFMAYIQRFQIIPEELAMAELFGDQFSDYRTEVRRWL